MSASSRAAVKEFIRHHYRHFNARTVVEAAEAWTQQLAAGNRMMVTLAGAMSTAELGLSLAELIRADKVHALSCTGANLEEDLFNLVAHRSYHRIADWRALTAEQEADLARRGLNRVTDTCIPEDAAMRKLEGIVLGYWRRAEAAGERLLPHEFFYRLIRDDALAEHCETDPRDSWLVAAAERDLPLFVPGWEDSTMANIFVGANVRGDLGSLDTVLSGVHYMRSLVDYYRHATAGAGLGFFQIGGGIAGDFPICVVPLISADLGEDCPLWSYFCQISDSTTSYGSYSGAVPNEKITWGKLDTTSPKFIIESDATIVAPLIFSYVLAS